MSIFTLINLKGGVGKTTSAINIAAALSLQGSRILLIDLDPQGHSSESLGLPPLAEELTSAEVLAGSASIPEAAIEARPGIFLLPADERLAELEASHSDPNSLRKALKAVRRRFDYIVIDCPPNFGFASIAALRAADFAIIPIIPDYLSSISTIRKTKALIHVQRCKLGMILAGNANRRRILTREILAHIEEEFPGMLAGTFIRTSAALAEAPSFGKSIFEYAPKSSGAQDFKALAEELIAREEAR